MRRMPREKRRPHNKNFIVYFKCWVLFALTSHVSCTMTLLNIEMIAEANNFADEIVSYLSILS